MPAFCLPTRLCLLHCSISRTYHIVKYIVRRYSTWEGRKDGKKGVRKERRRPRGLEGKGGKERREEKEMREGDKGRWGGGRVGG